MEETKFDWNELYRNGGRKDLWLTISENIQIRACNHQHHGEPIKLLINREFIGNYDDFSEVEEKVESILAQIREFTNQNL